MTTSDDRSHDLDSTFPTPNRRQLFGVLAGVGVGSAVFQRALAAQARLHAPMIRLWLT